MPGLTQGGSGMVLETDMVARFFCYIGLDFPMTLCQ